MSTKVNIEVDEQTADVLQTRAAELGVTVSELVAELATLESEPITVTPDEIAELDRRWKTIEARGSAVPHERVVRWLRTWGTPRYRPWPAQ
jgi:predicted transcriptional regulator